GAPGAYVTTVRPDAVHLSSVVGVVWFDPNVLAFRQFPGIWLPGSPWDRPPQVPGPDQRRLVAAFSGGFRIASSHGGMMLGDQVVKALQDRAATFAIDQAGVPAIGSWNHDLSARSSFDSVRQNLALIVQDGQPNP